MTGKHLAVFAAAVMTAAPAPAAAALIFYQQSAGPISYSLDLLPGVYTFQLSSTAPSTLAIDAGYDEHFHLEYYDGTLYDGTEKIGVHYSLSEEDSQSLSLQLSVPRLSISYGDGFVDLNHTPLRVLRHYPDPYVRFQASGPPGAQYTLSVVGRVTPDPVPEPGVWLLLVSGFAAAGTMLRGGLRGRRARRLTEAARG